MPRDLFVQTVDHKYAPKRSKWTIAGSILAHTVLLGALIVVPILSALDNYVVQASKLTFVVPPVMPAIAVPPPPKATTPTPTLNPKAAPPSPPEKPVTNEVTLPPVTAGPPVPGVPSEFFTGTGRDLIGPVGPGVPSITTYRPPEPKKAEPIRPGGNIKVPARTYYVEPVYPAIALAAKLEGYVILEATVDESGVVRNLKVLKSHPMLDKAALEAVAKWKYTPTLLNGVAVPIVMTVTVTFALR